MNAEMENPTRAATRDGLQTEAKTMHLRLVVENHAPRQRIPWWDLLHPMKRIGMSAELRRYFATMGASR